MDLYFNNAVNQSAHEAGNYWQDSECTLAHNSTPDWTNDSVTIVAGAVMTVEAVLGAPAWTTLIVEGTLSFATSANLPAWLNGPTGTLTVSGISTVVIGGNVTFGTVLVQDAGTVVEVNGGSLTVVWALTVDGFVNVFGGGSLTVSHAADFTLPMGYLTVAADGNMTVTGDFNLNMAGFTLAGKLVMHSGTLSVPSTVYGHVFTQPSTTLNLGATVVLEAGAIFCVEEAQIGSAVQNGTTLDSYGGRLFLMGQPNGWTPSVPYYLLPRPSEVQFDVPYLAYLGEMPAVGSHASSADVRAGVEYGNGYIGELVMPSAGDVRAGVMFDTYGSMPGTLAVPGAADVRAGVAVDDQQGTLDLPAEADVRLGIAYDAAAKTGRLDLPAEADVKAGVQYDAARQTGTFVGSTGGGRVGPFLEL